MVTFNSIPSNILTPGQYVEIDNSRALRGLPGKPHKALLMGIRRSTGSIAENIPTLITNAAQADAYFGVGSQLAEMIRAFKTQDGNVETWAIAMDEESGGTAAKFTITVTASSAGAGSIYLYVGGYRIVAAVAASDSASTIATAIAAKINEEVYAPFTASASSATVVVTFRHKGTAGNRMVPFVNHGTGEAYPFGVSLAMTNTLTITSSASSTASYGVTVGLLDAVSVPLDSAVHTTATLVAQAIKTALEATSPAYTISGAAAVLTFSFPMGYENNTAIAVSAGSTGVTATVGTSGALGATDPSYSGAIAVFGDSQWDTIVCPTAVDADLELIATELADRNDGDVMKDGQAFAALRGTVAALSAAGNGLNSQFVSLVGYPTSPDFPWVVAAQVAAADAGQSDPAQPRQTIALKGVRGPSAAARFTRTERNVLLTDGVSTLVQSADGVVRIERLITTYQTNANSVPDTSYRDITTLRTLSYLRWSWKAVIAQKYARHKLAADGTSFGPGQPIVTPSVISAEALAWFRLVELVGLVEGFAQFKDDLIVEIDGTDPNRLNVQMTPNIVNGLMIFATKIQFGL